MENEKTQNCVAKPILYKRCLRCGRILLTEEARLRGMGKICAEKAKRSKQIKLF